MEVPKEIYAEDVKILVEFFRVNNIPSTRACAAMLSVWLEICRTSGVPQELFEEGVKELCTLYKMGREAHAKS